MLLVLRISQVFPNDLIWLQDWDYPRWFPKQLEVFCLIIHYRLLLWIHTMHNTGCLTILKNDKYVLNFLKPLTLGHPFHRHCLAWSLLLFLGQLIVPFFEPFLLFDQRLQLVLFVRDFFSYIAASAKLVVNFIYL